MKSGLVNEFTSQTNAIPLTATLPPSITANKAALTKAKALRTSCRSRKVRFAVIDDSNGVPIDATASSTENYGTVALIEQALMMFRLNSTKLPQGGCILATHQGGGVKPLDSQTKDAASATLALNQIFRGDAACFSNLSGSLPAASLGATATLQGGAAHRNWYAIIDLTVNGPLKYRNLSTVYIEYMANANASGNQGVCGTGVPLLDGSGVTTVSTSGVDVGTAVVDLIDGTGLTLNNPLAGADMTAIDAAAVVNAQTTTINGVNTNPATIMGNVHATPLTLVANKINIIRIKPQANKVFVVPRMLTQVD